jgi:hypothetical protein
VALKNLHTGFTHKENFQNKKLFDYFDFVHPQHLAILPVNILSSKENSHKRKNDFDKRGEYRKFGDIWCGACLGGSKSNAVNLISR